MRARLLWLSVLAAAMTVAVSLGWRPRATGDSASRASTPGPAQITRDLPLAFEPNVGQFASDISFIARGRDGVVAVHDNRVVISVPERGGRQSAPEHAPIKPRPSHSVRYVALRLLGARPAAAQGRDRLPGIANYFPGNDSKRWRINVPTYSSAEVRGVYPGVDVVYYGNQRHLETDFVVAPGANPGAIRLAIDGADSVRLHESGDLLISVAGRELRQRRPDVYQREGDARTPIEGRYRLVAPTEVAFELGKYDETRPLVIDPVLAYSTYLGGSANDEGYAVAVDGSGNVFFAGTTDSTDFPHTAGAYSVSLKSGYDAFVSKLNATGTALLYSTYLGGSADDTVNAIAIDSTGDAFIIGDTFSGDFPTTTGAVQATRPGTNYTIFVTRLNATGSALKYSTYLGLTGSGYDYGNAIAVDPSGNAYVTGSTEIGSSFPVTAGAFQTSTSDCCPGFVTKINPTGTSLVYSTFLGDSNGYAIAVDSAGSAYVAGLVGTASSFPVTAGAFQTSASGAPGFVTKLNPTGSALVFSTFLGNTWVRPAGIAVDSAGHVFVAGSAQGGFPTTGGAFQTALRGSVAAFVSELAPDGSALLYSTLLGGSGSDYGYGLALDDAGYAYVTGSTNSTDFPVTGGAFQTRDAGTSFIARLTPDGAALAYSTYWGTNARIQRLTIDAARSVYVGGLVNGGTVLTTAGAFQTAPAGGEEAFISKLTLPPLDAPSIKSIAPPFGPLSGSQTVVLHGEGFQPDASVTFGGIPARVTVSSATALSATTPSNDAGVVDVSIFNPDGQSNTLPGGFQYVGPPIVSSIAPGSGPSAGGTPISISGFGFFPGASASIGGAPATSVAVGSPSMISAVTPANDAGVADVLVTNADGQQAILHGAFTFVAAPSPASVTPAYLSASSGGSITLTGSNFSADAGAILGGYSASNVVTVSSTTLTAIAPPHSAGTFDVVVVNADGQTGVLDGGLTYLNPPTLSSLDVTSGPSSGHTLVMLTGTGFVDGASVTFGGTAASPLHVLSSTSILATAPAHAAGRFDVAVVNPDGESATLSRAFTFLDAPTLTGITPSSGLTDGGTAVTLTGTAFADGLVVTLGGVSATDVSIQSPTTLTAFTPPHAAGQVDVSVSSAGQIATLRNGYEFVSPSGGNTACGCSTTSAPVALVGLLIWLWLERFRRAGAGALTRVRARSRRER